jgi:hypothetical protein
MNDHDLTIGQGSIMQADSPENANGHVRLARVHPASPIVTVAVPTAEPFGVNTVAV